MQTVAYEQHIPTTFMFMGSYGDSFEYSFTEMGGLRIINDYTSTPVAAMHAPSGIKAGVVAPKRPSLPVGSFYSRTLTLPFYEIWEREKYASKNS